MTEGIDSVRDVDERVDELLQSPLGCAFLLYAEASRLTPEEIAEPIISLYLCADASLLVEVWKPGRDTDLPEVLRRGSQKAGLARAILEQPGTAWWFAALDTDQQVYVPIDGSPPDPTRLIAPSSPPTSSERYSQRHESGLFTSSLVQETSSIYVALDKEVADIGLGWHGPHMGHGG